MLRIVKEVKPAYVVCENVTGIISLALDEVLASLEDQGYTCETFVLPACAVNAPHRRDRVWIVATNANSNGCDRCDRCDSNDEIHSSKRREYALHDTFTSFIDPDSRGEMVQRRDRDYPDKKRYKKAEIQKWQDIEFRADKSDNGYVADTQNKDERLRFREKAEVPQPRSISEYETWDNFPTQSPIRSRNDGLSTQLVRYTNGTVSRFNEAQTQGRNRKEALKGYGNAVVPQVALQIFKAIKEVENLNNKPRPV